MTRIATWQLFAVCVLVWGTTWYAITWQIAELAPEFGVALRFALAGATILAFAAWRGERLRFGAREHARFALQGAFMYGVSYVCVYHAEQHVVSGLVAVGYSASPLIVSLGARAAFGAPLSGRFLAGGLVGLLGVTLIFWPEIANDPSPLGCAFVFSAPTSDPACGSVRFIAPVHSPEIIFGRNSCFCSGVPCLTSAW